MDAKEIASEGTGLAETDSEELPKEGRIIISIDREGKEGSLEINRIIINRRGNGASLQDITDVIIEKPAISIAKRTRAEQADAVDVLGGIAWEPESLQNRIAILVGY